MRNFKLFTSFSLILVVLVCLSTSTFAFATFPPYHDGKFIPNYTINVRSAPSTTTGKVVAHYNPGSTIYFDKVIIREGYSWLTYLSYSGKRRYMVCGKVSPNLWFEPWGKIYLYVDGRYVKQY
jgi:hypothetical protein